MCLASVIEFSLVMTMVMTMGHGNMERVYWGWEV